MSKPNMKYTKPLLLAHKN